MGHRLSAMATWTGDAGHTGLGDGSRLSKLDPWVAAMGDLDGMNGPLGMLIALGVPSGMEDVQPQAVDVQRDLLDLHGELSIPDHMLLKPERVAALDAWASLDEGYRVCASSCGLLVRFRRPRPTCAAGPGPR